MFKWVIQGGLAVVAFIICIALCGCDQQCGDCPAYHDKVVKKTRKEFESILQPVGKAPASSSLKMCSDPSLPLCCNQSVSLCLSGQIPLSEALMELARQAKVNITIDGPLQKSRSVLYQAHNQPFGNVLENLCILGGLRYYTNGETIHVCEDGPYLKTHNVQFLLGARNVKTQTHIKTDVFAEGLHSKRSSCGDNGANISLDSQSTVDFWDELEKNIALLISPSEKIRKRKPRFSLNRYAGILSVYGNDRIQKRISNYLCQLRRATTTQVLIEAKIIEVTLSDEFKCGINWQLFLGGNLPNADNLKPLVTTNVGNPLSAVTAGGLARDVFSFSLNLPNLPAIVEFLNKFGTVRTIANPRMTVLNNHGALLKVAQNEVFFELQKEDVLMTQNSPYIQKTESRIQTIPIGLILYVQPSINFETGQIVLLLHPTISRVVGFKEDPAVSVTSDNRVVSRIPVVQTREMNTIIVARPDQVIVTGGLMEEIAQNSDDSVPGIGEIPLIGQLFRSDAKKRQITELVILLRLTCVTEPTPADTRLYENYTVDPRPLPLKKCR